MDELQFIRDALVGARSRGGLSLAEAAEQIKALGVDPGKVDQAVAMIAAEAAQIAKLDWPAGVTRWEYEQWLDDSRQRPWYLGPAAQDVYWPPLREQLRRKLGGASADEIDRESTKVVAQFAEPDVPEAKRKGLVLGYVQSGKTSNFTAVIAKSVDAGYRLVVVFAGIHNGLRQQTQRRLDSDLGTAGKRWVALTDDTHDFGHAPKGAGLAHGGVKMLAVVKKNKMRLTHLRNWLTSIPEDLRRKLPALIVDDEADQATPNTKAESDEISEINKLVRDIFEALPNATYVGYTATPFANVLINPTESTDLYPSDFIVDLPRRPDYFGAESLFGSLDGGSEDDGMDVVRLIPDDDVAKVSPPKGTKARPAAPISVPASLLDSLRWFVLATATRRARGQDEHSSMLVHTSQNVAPQFELSERIRDVIPKLAADHEAFHILWLDECSRVDGSPWHLDVPDWAAVHAELPGVLTDLRVVTDNGESDDRLTYDRKKVVEERTVGVREVVVAVGGNTLSRGLTLEGLVVSYFCRKVGTYDTLLQMGRWFGYRRGYEDLPRIWVTADILGRYRFLALVESEVRADIARYENENLTPSDLAIRIRTHPQLSITSPNKMFHAQEVKVSLAGTRLQTFMFHHLDAAILEGNLQAGRGLIDEAISSGAAPRPGRAGSTLLPDVPAAAVAEFLDSYRFHEKHERLGSSAVVEYVRSRTDPAGAAWNVVIVTRASSRLNSPLYGEVDLGTEDLGTGPVVRMNRSRLNPEQFGNADPATADIKALMSPSDSWIDFPVGAPTPGSADEVAGLRKHHVGGRGLLALYLISPASVPTARPPVSGRATRVPLDGIDTILGLGIIFPTDPGQQRGGEAGYVSVTLPGRISDEDEQRELKTLETDNEASMGVGDGG